MTDYETIGQNELSFKRYYNSFSMPDTYAVTMGQNWRTNYDRYLHFISANAIEAERATGQVVGFNFSSGSWSTDSDVDLLLTTSGSNWLLTDADDTVETYSSSGGKGLLSSVKLRNGYTQTLTYSSGHLASVSDSYSRSLGLTYSSSTGMLTGVTTPDTLALTYGYTAFSSANLLTSVSYNTSPVTKQTYLYENTSFPYALTGITDENNSRFATWSYDSAGRGAMSEHALGADHTEVTYDDSTGTRVVTGPLGIVETYTFSTLQGVPKVTQVARAANGSVASATRTFSYDSAGYLASSTDWNGNLTTYANNTHGDPTAITYASGSGVSHSTTIAYDTTWPHLPKTITTPGLKATLNYDSSGNLLTNVLTDLASQSVPYFTSGQTRTWTYTWNGTGQLLTARLPRTDVVAKTTYGYTGGTLTSVSDALSHVTTVLTYKSGGLPLTVTDPNSVLTTLAYNPRNWLTSSVLTLSSSAGTLTTSLTYDSAGNVTKLTLPDASYLSYGYDAAHRLTSITNRLNESQVLTLNSAGNITQALWKDASAVTKRQHTATYDALGRMRTDVGGVLQTTSFGYDSNDNVISVTDPLNRFSSASYDALNRISAFKDASTNLTTFTYDAHDRVLSVTDPRSHATSYVYDGVGEVIQETSPDRGTIVLHYSSDGYVSSMTDANGAVTNMTYDALDRVISRAYPADSSLNVTLYYDSSGHGKGIGRLTGATDQAGTLSLNYEERGLITSNARTISGTTYTTGFSFESAGRLATLTYASSGWVATYARDNAGQVSGITTKPPASGAVNVVTSITRLPFGPVKSMTWANGVTDARTFDLDYRMTSVKDVGTGNVYYSSFGYNAANDLTSVLDNVVASRNQTLTFDSSDRLNFASGTWGTLNLTYDSADNRKTYGGTTYTYPSTNNKLSAIGASSLTYDSAGNILAIGTSPAMAYNKALQLASATLFGTTSSYTYDAFGHRLKTVTGASPANIYSYGPGNQMLTESNANVETDYVYLDGFPISAIQPAAATISAMHTDYLGTPQKATNAAKTIVWYGLYDPNGKVTIVTGGITQNLRYAGQHQDATGFYNNGFRDYNPSFGSGGGRYLEADPIGLAGGINPFVYTENNTYRFTDPWGLEVYDDPLQAGLNDVAPANLSHGLWALGVLLPESNLLKLFNLARNLPKPKFSEPIKAKPTPNEPGGQCTLDDPLGNLSQKIQEQMSRRNWTMDELRETLNNKPGVPGMGKKGPSTRYTHPTSGKSAVVDDATGEVFHVGKKGYEYSDFEPTGK